MTTMTLIDEHGINRNLRVRYARDLIYVSCTNRRRAAAASPRGLDFIYDRLGLGACGGRNKIAATAFKCRGPSIKRSACSRRSPYPMAKPG